MAGGQEGRRHPQPFRNRRIFGNFVVSSDNVRTFAVCKDKGFEFYRKIFELGPPTLQVSRHLFWYGSWTHESSHKHTYLFYKHPST